MLIESSCDIKQEQRGQAIPILVGTKIAVFPFLVGAGFKPAWNQRFRFGIPVVRPSWSGFETRPEGFISCFNEPTNVDPKNY